jgi:hypothetical protein
MFSAWRDRDFLERFSESILRADARFMPGHYDGAFDHG